MTALRWGTALVHKLINTTKLHRYLHRRARKSMPFPTTVPDYADSSLSHKFGPEVTNYFSYSPLNRFSFLRENSKFISAALPASKFLLLSPTNSVFSASSTVLHYIPYTSISTLLPSPLPTDEDLIANYSSANPESPVYIFLGLDESDSSSFTFESYSGQPYFALCVPSDWKPEGVEGEWREPRLDLKLPRGDAALLAQARSIADWNQRNRFCAACGSRTIAVHTGTKRVCPSTDAGKPRGECVARKGVHNIAFPRTDPTVIMAILSACGGKVLLGRQGRWPKGFWSTLAGFCEPAESVEDAVRRETFEEAGVRVGRVVVHSSQPWPYPNSLMLGCIAQALPEGEEIHTGHDQELQEARWFDIAFVRERLGRAAVGLEASPEEKGDVKEGDIFLPPPTAIAHQLLLAVSNNFHGGLKI